MKKHFEIPLNISFMETVIRMLLIFPTTLFGIFMAEKFHGYILMQIPGYLLITALISFDPVKYLYRKIAHKPLLNTDPYLYSEVIDGHEVV